MEKNCSTCKHAGWDPDGNYCAAPKVLEKHSFGLNIPQRDTPMWVYGVKNFCEPDTFVLYEKNDK